MTDVEYLNIKFSSVHSYLIGKLTEKIMVWSRKPSPRIQMRRRY